MIEDDTNIEKYLKYYHPLLTAVLGVLIGITIGALF